MKASLSILFPLLTCPVLGQNLEEPKYRFAAEVFTSEKYQRKHYKRYAAEIEVLGDTAYTFGNRYVKVSPAEQKYFKAFKFGIFNPELIFGPTYSQSKEELDTLNEDQIFLYNIGRNDSLSICCFEELEALNPNDQTKRFKFWHFRIGFLNPMEYYIEFYNEKANNTTAIEDFFEDATMNFYYRGTIII